MEENRDELIEETDGFEDDFGFYGEEADEIEPSTVKGISGDVTGFTYTNLDYPCLVLKPDFKCPKHKLTVISNMVKSVKGDRDISIYYTNKGDSFKIGMINGMQVSAFLEVIGTETVIGFFDKDTKLENSLLYTLCTVC